MCTCASSEDCGCGALTIPRGPRGIQGVPGPAPVITATATALPSGSAPTAVVTGTSPNITLSLGIPAGPQGATGTGAPGVDGIAAFAPLSLGFFQPPVGSTAILTTTGSFKWAVDGEPVFIQGGGKYTVVGTPISPFTSMVVQNDGGTGNAAPGALVDTTGAPAQITPTGRDGRAGTPGTNGLPGTAGLAGVIDVVYSIPVSAPAANKTFVIYADDATNPTVIRGYSWSGSSWSATVNLTPAAGTQTIFVNGDPNILLPSGAIGTIAIRTDLISQIDYYIKSTSSSWTLQDSITIANTITQTVVAGAGEITDQTLYTTRVVGAERNVVSTGASTYNIDLAYEVTELTMANNMTLGWDNTNYDKDATWVLIMTNSSAFSRTILYATGLWQRNPAVTLPSSISVGDTLVYIIRRGADAARLIIENVYEPTNV